MKNKTFKYTIELTGPVYNEENVEQLFGKGSTYNPDYREDCIVGEDVYKLFQDALTCVYQSRMRYYADHKLLDDKSNWSELDKHYLKYLDHKIETYKKLEESLKLIKE